MWSETQAQQSTSICKNKVGIWGFCVLKTFSGLTFMRFWIFAYVQVKRFISPLYLFVRSLSGRMLVRFNWAKFEWLFFQNPQFLIPKYPFPPGYKYHWFAPGSQVRFLHHLPIFCLLGLVKKLCAVVHLQNVALQARMIPTSCLERAAVCYLQLFFFQDSM